MKPAYELFSGEELKIAELILRRRRQMLVHSYIYYERDENIISDKQWSEWGVELAKLQEQYPHIASQLDWADDFEDWDGSTGAFLPLKDYRVVNKGEQLLAIYHNERSKESAKVIEKPKPVVKKPAKTERKKLF